MAMTDFLLDTLRNNAHLAIFLTLGLGYWVGKLKIGKFELGSVTGVLLVGVLVGQLNIEVSPQVKSVFFALFLFAVGYSYVGITSLTSHQQWNHKKTDLAPQLTT